MLNREYAIINTKHDYLVGFTTDKNYKVKTDEKLITIKEFNKIMKHNF